MKKKNKYSIWEKSTLKLLILTLLMKSVTKQKLLKKANINSFPLLCVRETILTFLEQMDYRFDS